MRKLLPLPVFLLLAQIAHAQKEDDYSRAHIKLYKKISPAVVYIAGSGKQGSGVIIDKSGIVLTSTTACSQNAETVTVYTKGHLQHKGKVIGRVNDKDLVVIKIDGSDYTALELGDSDAVKLGQTAYVLGDCFQSMQLDDEPALSLGIISGIYEISKEKLRGSAYKGTVLETSAAVNQNQNGGPLVDREGRLLGLITLNYDESKFTGIAVPVNVLKKDIVRIRKEFESGATTANEETTPPKAGGGWLGLEVEEGDGSVKVTRVNRRGPADASGLKKGDVIKSIEGTKVASSKKYGELVTPVKPGQTLKLKVTRDGKDIELTITAGKKPVY